MTELAFHPDAEMVPLIDSNGFDELRRDIRERGMIEPITLLGGAILDGRSRYRAMRHIDPDFSPEKEPRQFVEFDGTDPFSFVISKNLHRRHLNESQRAMIAAKVLARSKKTGKGTPYTRAKLATALNTTFDGINRANRIVRYEPERIPAIEAGVERIGCQHQFRLRISVRDITEDEAEAFKAHVEKIGSTIADVTLACIQQILSGEISPTLPPNKDRRPGIVEAMKSRMTGSRLTSQHHSPTGK